MKKNVSIAVVTIAAFTLMSGCSATKGASTDMDVMDASVCKTAIYVGDRNPKSVLNAIKSGGKKDGWRMTEFKANSILAEKMIGSQTHATTITVAKEHIMCDKNQLSQSDLDSLRSAIVEELQKTSKH